MHGAFEHDRPRPGTKRQNKGSSMPTGVGKSKGKLPEPGMEGVCGGSCGRGSSELGRGSISMPTGCPTTPNPALEAGAAAVSSCTRHERRGG
jgi:hypothetical protein